MRRGSLGWHHDFDALRFVLDFLVRIALGFFESMMMSAQSLIHLFIRLVYFLGQVEATTGLQSSVEAS